MWTYIKKAIPSSFGASFAVTLVRAFRYPNVSASVSGIGDWLFNFIPTFIITTIIVAACIWLWERIFKNKRKE